MSKQVSFKPPQKFIKHFETCLKQESLHRIFSCIQTAYIQNYNMNIKLFERKIEGLEEEYHSTGYSYYHYPLTYICDKYYDAEHNWSNILQLLLKCNLNVNAKNWKGDNAMYIITQEICHRSVSFVKTLLNKGAYTYDIVYFRPFWLDVLRDNPTWTKTFFSNEQYTENKINCK